MCGSLLFCRNDIIDLYMYISVLFVFTLLLPKTNAFTALSVSIDNMQFHAQYI